MILYAKKIMILLEKQHTIFPQYSILLSEKQGRTNEEETT